jgi:sugar/nucleoside kinase (ribokinase family)
MLNHILESKMIFIGNLPDVSISDKLTIMKKCKENDIPIVLNLGVEDCRKDRKDLDLLLELADVCIVNKYEYADMIKKKADGLDLTKDCAKEINFQKKILVITDSSNGSYAYANKGIIKQQALHPKDIIDTTGAGDAFTSGFLAAYIHNESIENAMRQGAEYASEILGRIGAQ